MIDTILLRQFIKRSGLRLSYIADQLNITYVSLHNKLTGKNKFTLSEALTLRSILNLTQSEWENVFSEVV